MKKKIPMMALVRYTTRKAICDTGEELYPQMKLLNEIENLNKQEVK